MPCVRRRPRARAAQPHSRPTVRWRREGRRRAGNSAWEGTSRVLHAVSKVPGFIVHSLEQESGLGNLIIEKFQAHIPGPSNFIPGICKTGPPAGIKESALGADYKQKLEKQKTNQQNPDTGNSHTYSVTLTEAHERALRGARGLRSPPL